MFRSNLIMFRELINIKKNTHKKMAGLFGTQKFLHKMSVDATKLAVTLQNCGDCNIIL